MPWRIEPNFDCPNCGELAEINTTAPNGSVYEDDDLKCSKCKNKGTINVTSDDPDEVEAFAVWDF